MLVFEIKFRPVYQKHDEKLELQTLHILYIFLFLEYITIVLGYKKGVKQNLQKNLLNFRCRNLLFNFNQLTIRFSLNKIFFVEIALFFKELNLSIIKEYLHMF